MKNFGDEVTPLVFAELTGRVPKWAPIRTAEYAVIGSIIEGLIKSSSGATVAGAGLKAPLTAGGAHGLAQFHAVRGFLTADELGLEHRHAIGDPGLVIREIVGRTRGAHPMPVILPHFSVLNTRVGRRTIESARAWGANVVLPNADPLDVARQIASSSLVLTSSLHGMVFADAFGVPIKKVSFGVGKEEPEFKYLDYESIFPVRSETLLLSEMFGEERDALSIISELEVRTTLVHARLDNVLSLIDGAYEPLR